MASSKTAFVMYGSLLVAATADAFGFFDSLPSGKRIAAAATWAVLAGVATLWAVLHD